MAMNMRVTQRSMTRQYLKNMNGALGQMNTLNNRILAKRKFFRASENPVGAAKALNIRKNLANLDMYEDNLKTAKSIFDSAESSLLIVSDNVKNVTDRLLYAASDPKDITDLSIIANEIEKMADNMMAQMNSDYTERKLFGGTNNSSVPFTVEDGVVSYNGVPVNTQVVETVNPDGTTTYTFNGEEISAEDAKKMNSKLFPGSNPILIDVGIGIQYDENGIADPQTALDISLNGAELLGSGVNDDGTSKNLLQLCYDAVTAVRNGNKSDMQNLIEKIKDSQETLLVGITNLGISEQAVDFYQIKVDDDRTNLSEAQINAEGMTEMELAEAITNWKAIDAAYNATLQMGGKIIPQSIFDFIR